MSTIALAPSTQPTTSSVVRTCYDLLTVVPACGLTDFTDGKYVDERNDRESYLAAQQRQAEFLLDQAQCRRGTRLLDIGCGYGRILEHAAQRGAQPLGITISPPQVTAGRARGRDVRELNYRHIFGPNETSIQPPYADAALGWAHAFDAVIANGSLEHFVQVSDAIAGHADDIYHELFAICHRLLSAGGRFVTTAIHFRRAGQFDPAAIARGPNAFRRGSAEYQYAALVDVFGGWYPEPRQLKRCAEPYFDLVEQEDGTHDYHLTSEYWQRRFFRSLAYSPRVWWALGRQLVRRPREAWAMFKLQVFDQSWPWQFRPPAPMQLWRQTWLAK